MNVNIIKSVNIAYSWNPSTCIYKSNKYLKNITGNSVTEWDKILIFMDNFSKQRQILQQVKKANVTSTASIIWHDKIFFFAYSSLSDHITIDNYYHLLSSCKTKNNNIK